MPRKHFSSSKNGEVNLVHMVSTCSMAKTLIIAVSLINNDLKFNSANKDLQDGCAGGRQTLHGAERSLNSVITSLIMISI